ncbi:MAG: ACP S-malonyltransferase [Mobilitalea sp.]
MNRIAYVFPGQGAQYVGMGKDFYDNFAECRELFDSASELLKIDMRKLCFEENDNLNMTEYTQAAMVLVCAAILLPINRQKPAFEVCAGLSLGEYTALIASGVISFEDAIRVVRQRGILMQNTVPKGVGGMAAILGLEGDVIREICENIAGSVSIANYNCPGQIVITGEIVALNQAKMSCLEAGAKRALDLNVSGPFHSELLKPAGEKLKEILSEIKCKKPIIPYVSNVTAEYVESEDLVKELLVKQIYSPVRWSQSVESMINQGITTFIEIGPGKTLSGFIKKINPSIQVINIDKVQDLDKIAEVFV